jgi:hypothetical protein
MAAIFSLGLVESWVKVVSEEITHEARVINQNENITL